MKLKLCLVLQAPGTMGMHTDFPSKCFFPQQTVLFIKYLLSLWSSQKKQQTKTRPVLPMNLSSHKDTYKKTPDSWTWQPKQLHDVTWQPALRNPGVYDSAQWCSLHWEILVGTWALSPSLLVYAPVHGNFIASIHVSAFAAAMKPIQRILTGLKQSKYT